MFGRCSTSTGCGCWWRWPGTARSPPPPGPALRPALGQPPPGPAGGRRPAARLVQRAGRGIRLTEAGRRAGRARAEEILGPARRRAGRAGRLHRPERRPGAAGGVPVRAGHLRARRRGRVRRRAPRRRLRLRGRPSRPTPYGPVRSGEVDVACLFDHPADRPTATPMIAACAGRRCSTSACTWSPRPTLRGERARRARRGRRWISGCERCRGQLVRAAEPPASPRTSPSPPTTTWPCSPWSPPAWA